MIAALMGVPGKLKTLLDRLTATRAGNLDNLDAAVTTRAPASTALSTSTWTGTLATDLATISSGASAFTGIVNSIQYGSITISTTGISGTATITAVNVNKSVLIHLGQKVSVAGQDMNITLTNTTTVTANRSYQSSGDSTVRFCVLEFK